jgi:hypothetical protein
MIMSTSKLCAVLLISLCAPFAHAGDAATIEKTSGAVTVVGADGKSRNAAVGDKIGQGESVTTGASSDALLKASDSTVVILRPNTRFQFTKVSYEDGPNDSIILKLFKGTARMATGLIGKANKSRFTLQTTTATIGIRGTDFEVAIIPEGSEEGRAGVYDFVHDGGTNIKLANGPDLDVNEDQTGFAPDKPAPGEAPLQLLDSRPAFFKGGGFDTLMQQLSVQPMRIMQQMPRLH